MKKKFKGLLALAGLAVVMGAGAANTPCSGGKGGVARCDGARFVCKDGSYSASKKTCAAGGGASSSDLVASSSDGSSSARRHSKRRH